MGRRVQKLTDPFLQASPNYKSGAVEDNGTGYTCKFASWKPDNKCSMVIPPVFIKPVASLTSCAAGEAGGCIMQVIEICAAVCRVNLLLIYDSDVNPECDNDLHFR